ncbi:hypothetical protein R1flu_020795 [Riccia fluitans]|uniref:Uncharacterized protein n=1 Tax=Riccia fluitans TaxID=41844 RepID=A0ABD1ZMI1_9MARC
MKNPEDHTAGGYHTPVADPLTMYMAQDQIGSERQRTVPILTSRNLFGSPVNSQKNNRFASLRDNATFVRGPSNSVIALGTGPSWPPGTIGSRQKNPGFSPTQSTPYLGGQWPIPGPSDGSPPTTPKSSRHMEAVAGNQHPESSSIDCEGFTDITFGTPAWYQGEIEHVELHSLQRHSS